MSQTKAKSAKRKEITISLDDFGMLAICAIRYCHGRETYMPTLIQSVIEPHLTEIMDSTLDIMIEDCGFQERMHLYGSETIDKPSWIAWRDKLKSEQERRNGEV